MKRFDKTTIVLGIITLFVLAFAVTLFVTSTMGKNSRNLAKSSSSSKIISSVISNDSSSSISSETDESSSEVSSTKSSKGSSENTSSSISSLLPTGTLDEGQLKVKIVKAENGKYNVLVLDSPSTEVARRFLVNGKTFNLTLNTRNQMEVDKVYLLDGVFEENSKISVSLKAQPKEVTE